MCWNSLAVRNFCRFPLHPAGRSTSGRRIDARSGLKKICNREALTDKISFMSLILRWWHMHPVSGAVQPHPQLETVSDINNALMRATTISWYKYPTSKGLFHLCEFVSSLKNKKTEKFHLPKPPASSWKSRVMVPKSVCAAMRVALAKSARLTSG